MSDHDARFVEILDFEFTRDPGKPVVVSVTVAEKHRNANRVVHGSVIHALLDTVMGFEAYLAHGPVGTAEMSIRFLEPLFDGRLNATARILKAGKRLIVMDSEVRRDGVLVAVGQGTFARVRDPRAPQVDADGRNPTDPR